MNASIRPAPLLIAPRWLVTAFAEMNTQEIAGASDNPRIVEYHRATELAAGDDETPWCAAFVCWLFRGHDNSPRSAAARSFLKFGVGLDSPRYGCVAVLWRAGSPTSGHVGLYVGHDEAGNVLLLGGNQGNRVCVAPYPATRVLAYRWPVG